MAAYETVIGLEVHAQLSTDSKIFACSSAASGEASNTLTDPTTLGLPGSLPVLNKRVVDMAIRLALATNCEVQQESIFERKHYLYPDLPKGYQISQYEKPLCTKGWIDIRSGGQTKRIGITRIHLEEDAGKSMHLESESASIVDLNRAGVPLVEIVSEPELRTPEEAGAYVRHIRQIVRYLDICDGNMEEGSLRCDANISLRKQGEAEFGTKVEIKNLNSFRFIEKALAFETQRQIAALEEGKEIVQETRLWDEAKSLTRPMRSKEFAEDYRYFPDPDLLPVIVDYEWVETTRASLPELPEQVQNRFRSAYGLDDTLVELLSEEKFIAQYYDSAISFHDSPIAIANWITTELFGRLNREGVEFSECPVSPENLAGLVKLVDEDVISGKIAKTVFDEMFETSSSADSIVEKRKLKQVSDVSLIEEVVQAVLKENPEQVEEFRGGKEKVLGFFVGQIMKRTQGKANPRVVNEVLKKKLS